MARGVRAIAAACVSAVKAARGVGLGAFATAAATAIPRVLQLLRATNAKSEEAQRCNTGS